MNANSKTPFVVPRVRLPRRVGLWSVALPALLAANVALAQQTVTLRSMPLRVTVPVGDTATNTAVVTVTMAGGTDPVNLAVSGLPAGAGASLDVSSFTASGTANLTLLTTNLPQGEYDVAVVASGAAAYRLPLPIISSHFWSGGSFTSGVSTNFATAGNWVSGAVPGPADEVVFSDMGAVGAAGTPANVIVSGNQEVASVRFAQQLDQDATRFYNLEIQSGATLSVTGPGGLSLLRDLKSSNRRMDVKFSGGGTLAVNNPGANIAVLIDNQANATLDLRDLDHFVTDVNRIGFGDYRLYPNFYTNGYTGAGTGAQFPPARFIPLIWLAKTNIIKAAWVDPNNYLDGGIREYALTIGNNERQGSTTALRLSLGLSNAFFLDSICFSQSGSGASGNNYNFNAAGSYALFRGIGGGRMSVWAQGDAGGVDNSGSNVRGNTVNFSNGRVEAFIDRMYLGRDRTNTAGMTIQAILTFGEGFFDVNNAYLGFQGAGENLGTGASVISGPAGTVNVNSPGVFRVNETLHLGYTTGANPGVPTYPENASGVVNIAGGTVMASNILAGGVSKHSANNNITLTAGGKLIVSNRVATVEKWLTTLNMTDSTLVLHVNGASLEPYAYATNLLTGGAGNIIQIASVTGISSFPATVPLIAYGSASPNFSVQFPPGLFGYVVNNAAAKTVDVVITDVPPKNVVWNGTPGGTWDTTSANWQGGQMFTDGDSATFDDSATGTTTVNVSGTVTPGSGGILVSNETKAYTLTGGTIAGTGVMVKDGAATLTVDATSEVPLVINEGVVNGNGALGATTVGTGATLNFAGQINRLTTSGTTTSSGTVNLGLAVSGGTFVNSSSGTVNGTVNFTSGASTNNGTINSAGVSTVGAGAVLVHNGRQFAGIANVNSRLSVAGTVTGTGVFTDKTGDPNGNNGRFSLDAGGVLAPGNTGIGTFSIEGRFDLNPNARLIVEVDLNHPQKHDIVAVDKWSNTRGIIEMVNIGAAAFAAGQSFHVISNNFSLPNTPEAAADFSIQPPSPGVGLQWDVSNLRTNGVLAIVNAPATPPELTRVFTSTSVTLSWAATHLGWQLQAQTNDLSTGITTTWHPVVGSENTTQYMFALDPANPTVFFRLFSIAP